MEEIPHEKEILFEENIGDKVIILEDYAFTMSIVIQQGDKIVQLSTSRFVILMYLQENFEEFYIENDNIQFVHEHIGGGYFIKYVKDEIFSIRKEEGYLSSTQYEYKQLICLFKKFKMLYDDLANAIPCAWSHGTPIGYSNCSECTPLCRQYFNPLL